MPLFPFQGESRRWLVIFLKSFVDSLFRAGRFQRRGKLRFLVGFNRLFLLASKFIS
jgi:hypothetical protein